MTFPALTNTANRNRSQLDIWGRMMSVAYVLICAIEPVFFWSPCQKYKISLIYMMQLLCFVNNSPRELRIGQYM